MEKLNVRKNDASQETDLVKKINVGLGEINTIQKINKKNANDIKSLVITMGILANKIKKVEIHNTQFPNVSNLTILENEMLGINEHMKNSYNEFQKTKQMIQLAREEVSELKLKLVEEYSNVIDLFSDIIKETNEAYENTQEICNDINERPEHEETDEFSGEDEDSDVQKKVGLRPKISADILF